MTPLLQLVHSYVTVSICGVCMFYPLSASTLTSQPSIKACNQPFNPCCHDQAQLASKPELNSTQSTSGVMDHGTFVKWSSVHASVPCRVTNELSPDLHRI